jgi:hypothetical protein
MIPKSHYCKLYHPFTFNIPKSFLPDINFFTLPIKNLGREEWSILTESSWDNESTKLLLRACTDAGRNEGLFEFLHNIQKFVEGRKDKKKRIADPKNFYLNVGGGTGKSITEVANLLHPFKENYFLRKENCPYKIDWEKILTDNVSYHVFLSMWLKDNKLKEFMVLSLLRQIIENRHYAKKPILIVIPEIKFLCKRNPQGYQLFLSDAISNALSTIRSMGKGMSSIFDSQNWSDTDDRIKGCATVTLFGQLNSKDQEGVCKANQYKREIREQLQNMEHKNSYLIYGNESYGAFRVFLPSHMHKEPDYNWIEMYRKHFGSKMKRYEDLRKFMREEYKAEELVIKDSVDKQIRIEEEEIEKRKAEKETKKSPRVLKEQKKDNDKERLMRLCYEMSIDENLSKRERSWRKIASRLSLNHVTAQKYAMAYEKKLEIQKELDKEIPKEFIGEGIMPEELDMNKADS